MQDSLTPVLNVKLKGDTLTVQIENSLTDGSSSPNELACCSALDKDSVFCMQTEVVLVESLKHKLLELHSLVHSDHVCILIEGSSGNGKTTLLKIFAQLHSRTEGNGLVTIHLGEQVDGKMLIGTFTCTNVPGEFVWVPGILTKAVLGAQWVVLEDIDCAPSDVVSLLLSVVKNRCLLLPGYCEPLKVPQDFKMFMTKRISEGLVQSSLQSHFLGVLENHCSCLHMPGYSQDEIKEIIRILHPNLACLLDQLLGVCESLKVHIRQVLKFCDRISDHVHDGRIFSAEDMMLELIDCFVVPKDKLSIALKLRPICGGMSSEKVEQLLFKHKPSLQLSSRTIVIGRGYLTSVSQGHSNKCFAYTRHSLCLMERVCRCVQKNEPVLLVGETGIGKTSTVHYLSDITGNKLVVMNMSQQSDSSDLLGGFKPIPVAEIVLPIREKFEKLFQASFSLKHNAKFLSNVQKCFVNQQWRTLFKMMLHSLHAAVKRLEEGGSEAGLLQDWESLHKKIQALQQQFTKPQGAFVFSFVEGVLVSAVRNGWWILLDEINLATAETLQCLSSLLEGPKGSFLIAEQCDVKPVERHTNFRLFCCMNPATDVGKKSLPQNIRNRFSEIFVEEMDDTTDIRTLILSYLPDLSSSQTVDGIIRYYCSVKELAETRLLDSTGKKPHYSLRNLCRALHYARSNPCGTLPRSLYEGLCMSFLTQLRQDQHALVVQLAQQSLALSDQFIHIPIPEPKGPKVVQVEGFWLSVGSEMPVVEENFVLTKSVKQNLRNLARVVSARQYPVLLQGPTSAGKTSLIQYLAKATGHRCLRVNNHEHTDLQEYVGMYTAGNDGQLVFHEGVLVEAMRKGYWIILDELNLAPTDVLEALNRVLDDNRELFIPETHQVVKAHPHFLLFGTQNPPGQYGGRKVLSQAFRNRFIELHYEDIPSEELSIVLQQRCKIPQSYAKRMVAVMRDLQQQRSLSGIFAGKYGLITLRDLFRWAERYRRSSHTETFWDWEQQIAEDGRVRNTNEENIILDVIQKHFKRDMKLSKLFGTDGSEGGLATAESLKLLRSMHLPGFAHIVWTPELLRMAILLHRAIQFDEPVLLVGNTGCGKTSVCQLISKLVGKSLLTINCHMHTEASDFLGGLRPFRKTSEQTQSATETEKLFEWCDGILVQAMLSGSFLLIDEISLAEDAVLERLNSVLETERKLLVSERGSTGDMFAYEVVALEGFILMATMNPGGDYGKKELSPALRNRFVEIWCPTITSRESCQAIIDHNLRSEFKQSGSDWATIMLDITDWMQRNVLSNNYTLSIRDLLAWVTFMNSTIPALTLSGAFYHGAHLTFVDGLGCNGQSTDGSRDKELTITYIQQYLINCGLWPVVVEDCNNMDMDTDEMFGISPFYIQRGPLKSTSLPTYSLDAKGPHQNAFRLLRGLQLQKPILLEGGPGVGKTTLVVALAKASGHNIVRINLSEYTDTSDLFGSDLPVEGSKGLRFAWKDGPFLKALKNGDWILLDELNLASQSVLESLNACLDHRGEVYIPELNMTFKVKLHSRLFACQNPLQQGGGRKGLPKSFVNRFTQIFVNSLTSDDFLFITRALYPQFSLDLLKRMISFNEQPEQCRYMGDGEGSLYGTVDTYLHLQMTTAYLCNVVKVDNIIKQSGNTAWEFNLRDILRWCNLIQKYQEPHFNNPGMFVELIYLRRLRTEELRQNMQAVFEMVFGCSVLAYTPPTPLGCHFSISRKMLQVGYSSFTKRNYHVPITERNTLVVQHDQIPILDALLTCTNMGWMSILVGSSCVGKASTVKVLAELTGNKLVEFPMNSDTDTAELLGGFEQVNCRRHCSNFASLMSDVLKDFKGHLLKELSYKSSQMRVKVLRAIDTVNKFLSKIAKLLPEAIIQEGNTEVSLLELEELLQMVSEFLQQQGYAPFYDFQYLRNELKKLGDLLLCDSGPGQFEWVDSLLVKALKHGHWLLISNANFCSPSVLDRLNALLEPNGILTIDERGMVDGEIPSVEPHPNFRLFLAMDSSYGELSRAMRNRGVEIFLMPSKELITSIQSPLLVSPSKVMTVREGMLCPEVASIKAHCSSFINLLQKYVQRKDSTVLVCDLLSISSELELFTSMASCSDFQHRIDMLHQICAILKHQELKAEIFSAQVGLNKLMNDTEVLNLMKTLRAETGLEVGLGSILVNPLVMQTISDNEPLIKVAEQWLLRKMLRTMHILIEEHCRTNTMLSTLSPLQISCAAHQGKLPLDFLEDISLAALYPFASTILKALDDADSYSKFIDAVKVKTSLDWLVALLRLAMISTSGLSDIAVAFDMFSTESLSILVLLMNDKDCTVIGSLVEKLNGLRVLLLQGQLLASWKAAFGHRQPPSAKEGIEYMEMVYLEDRRLCSGTRIYIDEGSVELRKRIGTLMVHQNENDLKEVREPFNNSPENGMNIGVTTMDKGAVLVALKPVVSIITDFIGAFLEEGQVILERTYPDAVLVNSLLNYCLQLSYVDILKLEPLFMAQARTSPLKEFIPQLLQLCTPNGFAISLKGTTSITTYSPYQNNLSEFCYSLLSPAKPAVAVTLGNWELKLQDLSQLLQQLWLHGSSESSSFASCCYSELRLIKSLIRTAVSTLADSLIVEKENEKVSSELYQAKKDWSTLNPEIIRYVFQMAAKAVVGSQLYRSLEVAAEHLIMAHGVISALLSKEKTPDLSYLLDLKIGRVHLGIVLSVLACPCSPIDPVGVENSKWKFSSIMHKLLASCMAACSNYLNVLTGKHLEDFYSKSGLRTSAVAPYLHSLREKVQVLAFSQQVGKKQRAVPFKYPQLVKACLDLIGTICSPHKLDCLLKAIVHQEPEFYRKITSWQVSTLAALNKIVNDYPEYPDMVQPLTMALLQVEDGLIYASDIVRYQNIHKSTSAETAASLLDFSTKCHLHWVQSAMTAVLDMWNQGAPLECWNGVVKRIMVIAVDVSWHHTSSYEKLPFAWKEVITSLLELIVTYWRCIDNFEAAKEKEKDELYLYKVQRSSIKESEETIDELFPLYNYQVESNDYSESKFIEVVSEDIVDVVEAEGPNKHLQLLRLSTDDMLKTCRLYLHLHNSTGTLQDDQSPSASFAALYELTSDLFRTGSPVPGSYLDDKLISGHIRLCNYFIEGIQNVSAENMAFNIYKDPLPTESQKVLPIVKLLIAQVDGLLIEWPEHPVLMQIHHGCMRVLQFSVLDPLMKILSGLEYILRKAQEWESNASTAVSLMQHIGTLTSLVLEWRKMELLSWKRLFLICESEVQGVGACWLFHLLSLCDTQAAKSPSSDLTEFMTAIESLMETSAVGEFSLKLQLLCACCDDFFQRGRDPIANILGNSFAYYHQFLPDINGFIRQQAEPLEKELHDFVTIQRWCNGNYWALKSSTEKSRKTLTKLMRKYKTILQEPVQMVLSGAKLTCLRGGSNPLKELLVTRTSMFTVPLLTHEQLLQQTGIKVYLSDSFDLSTHEIFAKMKSMMLSYVHDELHQHVYESVASLKDQVLGMLHLLETVQVGSDAKSTKMLLEQHKKAVNDLFKALQKEGLSYRKGLVAEGLYNIKTVFSLPLGKYTARLLGTQHDHDWHKLFFETVTGMQCLHSFLESPSKQLNSNHISRIKGLSRHLHQLVCIEKEVLGVFPEKLMELDYIVNKLGLAVESFGEVLLIDDFQNHKSTLFLCFEESIDAILELKTLLATKPPTVDSNLTPFSPDRCGVELFTIEDTLLVELQGCVQSMEGVYHQALKNQWSLRNISEPFISRSEACELEQGFGLVKSFAEKLLCLGIHESNPLFGNLILLGRRLLDRAQVATSWMQETYTQCADEWYINHLAKLLRPVMTGIQKIVHLLEQHKSREVSDLPSLSVMHKAIVKSLEDVNLGEVISGSNCLLQHLLTQTCSNCVPYLQSVYHILRLYGSFVRKLLSDALVFHTHICSLYSAVLRLFCLVVDKGFCSDAHCMENGGAESTKMAETPAGGFDNDPEADGSRNVDPTDVSTENCNLVEEGEKDSSDKGNRDDENTCENDDDDDFSGVLESVDDEDNGDESKSSDGDTSEEMGPVEKDEDHLDEHMWAPDNNEEDHNVDPNDLDSGQGTAVDSEQKVVAKDDDAGKVEEEPETDVEGLLEDESPLNETENDENLMNEPCSASSDDDDINEDNNDEVPDNGDDLKYEDQSDDVGLGPDEAEGVDSQEMEAADETDYVDERGTAPQNQEAVQPEAVMSSEGLQDAKENSSSSHKSGVAADNRQSDNEQRGKEFETDETVDISTSKDDQQDMLGQSIGKTFADKRAREDSLPPTSNIDEIVKECASQKELEIVAKRPKLISPSVSLTAKDMSDVTEYVHNPDGTSVGWDAASQDNTNQKSSLEDDETMAEVNKRSNEEGKMVHDLPLQEFVSYFSHHMPVSCHSDLDTEALKHIQQRLQTGMQLTSQQVQYQLSLDTWMKYEALVMGLSTSLCEELRIILQPTLAAHLRGDFRSGKKLNMRRIVPYIASGFRNDRIWLRRVKPSRRDYEILIAVDDSSSMMENNCTEMAYKSIAMISGALQRLDCGQLGLFKFGERTHILHPLSQPFTSFTGATVLQEMTFTQKRTNYVKMLETAAVMFSERDLRHKFDIKQLLIVLSDGRGVFSEGEMAVELAIRYMNEIGILTVFIILDCSAEDSVVNIQVPVFYPGKAPQIRKYLETFPFQFYIVLKDVISLPAVLGQALHQWFEYVNKV